MFQAQTEMQEYIPQVEQTYGRVCARKSSGPCKGTIKPRVQNFNTNGSPLDLCLGHAQEWNRTTRECPRANLN